MGEGGRRKRRREDEERETGRKGEKKKRSQRFQCEKQKERATEKKHADPYPRLGMRTPRSLLADEALRFAGQGRKRVQSKASDESRAHTRAASLH